jgi:hypothetical protein
MVFLDAAVTCLMLVKRDAPINPVLDDPHGTQTNAEEGPLAYDSSDDVGRDAQFFLSDENHPMSGLDENFASLINIKPPSPLRKIVIDPPHPKFVTGRPELRRLAVSHELPSRHGLLYLGIR